MSQPNKKQGVATAHNKLLVISQNVAEITTECNKLQPIVEQLKEATDILERLRRENCEKTKRSSFK